MNKQVRKERKKEKNLEHPLFSKLTHHGHIQTFIPTCQSQINVFTNLAQHAWLRNDGTRGQMKVKDSTIHQHLSFTV